MTCGICGGDIRPKYERAESCPNCGSTYCPECFADAEQRGDISTDLEYVGEYPAQIYSIRWHRCRKCGVLS